MPFRLYFELLILLLLFLFIVFKALQKKKIIMKYALLWLFSCFFIILLLFMPKFLKIIANILGIKTVSNLIFLFGFIVLFFLIFSLTVIVSGLKEKNVILCQQIGILTYKMDLMENKMKESNQKVEK